MKKIWRILLSIARPTPNANEFQSILNEQPRIFSIEANDALSCPLIPPFYPINFHIVRV
jgi:hypothetical protein